MARAKTARAPKPKPESKILTMPESGGNGELKRGDLESEIRLRAYQLYEERGYTNGRADQDWFDAEQQVLARHGSQKHTA